MLATRAIGAVHLYEDQGIDQFSNVALGLLMRAVGHGLKVAYIDSQGQATRFSNFLENFCLSRSTIKRFDRFHVELFTLKSQEKISRTLLPAVEFSSLSEELFWKALQKFDLVLFDNLDFSHLSLYSLKQFLNARDPHQEIVFTTKDSVVVKELEPYCDLFSVYSYKKNPLFKTKKSLKNITGDGKGKSTYSFGYLLRNFLNKEDVKLIYFDKGGTFYGERIFFDALKKWCQETKLYGNFDYAATGMRRFDGRSFRFENIPEDYREAEEGLKLLKTAIRKQSPVVAEELNTTVKTGLLKEKDILELLEGLENELLLTGRYAPKSVLEKSDIVLEVLEKKHYSKQGFGVRKGIDY